MVYWTSSASSPSPSTGSSSCVSTTRMKRLQEKFCRDLFRSVQAEYEDEHVPWAPIDFPDAQAALKLHRGADGSVGTCSTRSAARRARGVLLRCLRLVSDLTMPGVVSLSSLTDAQRRGWLGAGSRVEAEDLA